MSECLSALSFVLPYDDGGERLSISYDSRSKFWSDQVVIRQNESDDRVICVDLADLDWLIAALRAARRDIPYYVGNPVDEE